MKSAFILVFVLCCSFKLKALEVPSLSSPVMDLSQILDSSQKAELERILLEIDQACDFQMAVLIIPSLQDEYLEGYSIKVVENWKLGEAKKDNGVLILVALKEHKIRIEVGYGLEGKLTDVISSQIIRSKMTPYFKQGDYYQGLKEAVLSVRSYVEDPDSVDLSEKKSLRSSPRKKIKTIIILAFMFLIFILIMPPLTELFMFLMVFSFFSEIVGSPIVLLFFFGALALKFILWKMGIIDYSAQTGRNYRSGGRGGWGSSGGGFGGGGFSGGGGGFGGGGASGGW